MSYLPHNYLRVASALAVLVFVPAWKSGSILNSTLQAQGPASVVAPNASKPSNANVDPAAAARISSSYGKLPISFEENQGQTDKSVQFLARGAGYTLFLAPGEAVLSLHAPHVKKDRPGSLAVPSALRKTPAQLTSTTPPSTVRLQLIGSNTMAKAEGVDPLPGKSNYFVGSDPAKWHTDVPTYAKVRYSDVYPGIDLLYYGNQEGRLEHDFVVAPGADPNAIAIGARDSEGAVPNKNGGLTLHTKTGDLTLHSPVVYQTIGGQRTTIPATYLLADNQIKFQLGSYDRNAPLIIDPVIQYTAAFGGSSQDDGSAIAVDSSGNAYIAGGTESRDFPGANPFQSSWSSQFFADAFVSKINASGTALLYSTFLGANGYASGIAVDNAGRAYVVGQTSTGFPVKNAYQATCAGGTCAFLTVVGPKGNTLIYSTYLSGSGQYDSARGYAIALDASGNAYMAGENDGNGGFPTLHSVQTQGQIFVAKFNSMGVLQYSSVFGTNGWPEAVAVDASGAAYVAGPAFGPGNPVTKNAFLTRCPSDLAESCGFVAKLSPSGDSLAYATYLGGWVFGLAVDSSGGAYVAGHTPGGVFPVTKNAFQKTFVSGRIIGFVAKLNSSGTGLIWSTYLGGGVDDKIEGLALDQYRQVYVTGETSSPDFPLKAPVQTYKADQGSQAFVATLSGSLSSIVYYSTYLSADCVPCSIAVDKALNVYVVGSSRVGIQTTPGALSTGTPGNPGGDYDIYVSKFVIMDDIALGVSASAGTVVHGGNLTYTLAVTSKGPDFGYNVRITDPLPAGTTFVSYDAGGGSCTAPAVGGTGTLSCEVLRLEKGDTYTVKLTVNVNAAAGTKLSNTATSVSNMQDFVPANNTGTLTTMVN